MLDNNLNEMTIEIKDYITIFGIIVTLIIGMYSLYIGLKNSKKTLYINAITTARLEHMERIRNAISEFCALNYHLVLTELSVDARNSIILKIDSLRFLIKLLLDRTHEYDQRIILKIDTIPELSDLNDTDQLESEINELVILTQDLLNLEWQGAKKEANEGPLKTKIRDDLVRKHLGQASLD